MFIDAFKDYEVLTLYSQSMVIAKPVSYILNTDHPASAVLKLNDVILYRFGLYIHE